MASSADLFKRKFFENNAGFTEIVAGSVTDEGDLSSISEQDEVWLLQCPKGTQVASWRGQKLKLPGRSSGLGDLEAVAAELDTAQQVRAFGFTKHGQNVVRLLPIKGSIVLRSRLPAVKSVTVEETFALCPPAERVPMPEVKVRHPLLGRNYEKSVKLDKQIAQRLKDADENSTRMIREARSNRKRTTTKLPMVGKQTVKAKISKTKRQSLGSNDPGDSTPTKKGRKTPKREMLDAVSKDLEWIKMI